MPQPARSRSSDQRAMASDLRLFHALGLEPPNHRCLMQLNSNTAEMCEHRRATVVTEGNRCPTDAAALASPDQNHGVTVTSVASIAVPVTRTTAKSHERKSWGTKSREWWTRGSSALFHTKARSRFPLLWMPEVSFAAVDTGAGIGICQEIACGFWILRRPVKHGIWANTRLSLFWLEPLGDWLPQSHLAPVASKGFWMFEEQHWSDVILRWTAAKRSTQKGK